MSQYFQDCYFVMNNCRNKIWRLILDRDFNRRAGIFFCEFCNLFRSPYQPDTGIPAVAPDIRHYCGEIIRFEWIVNAIDLL